MVQLRDRNKFPPGGFRFYQPETNWSPPTWLSFHDTVLAIIDHRNRNPHQRDRYGWLVDYNAVCDELDAYNSRICLEMKWNDFIMGEGIPAPPPKASPLPLPSGRPVVAGAKSLAEWTIDGEVVPEEIAATRANICRDCPVNHQGTLRDFFTEAAANLIQRQFEIRQNRELKTPWDEKLGMCDACGCPLKLKVHAPMHVIEKYLSQTTRDKLDPRCWILNHP
jgi:hypothetical protein